jgi:hypothetical protein
MAALFICHRGLGSREEEATPEEREEALLFYHPGACPLSLFSSFFQ